VGEDPNALDMMIVQGRQIEKWECAGRKHKNGGPMTTNSVSLGDYELTMARAGRRN